MAYMKRKVKRGKFQIDGKRIIITSLSRHPCGFSEHLVDAVWVQAWRRLNQHSMPSLTIEKNKDGSIPLYKKDNADSTYFRIGEGRIETPEERIKKNDRLKELTRVDFSDRPPLKYQMRFTRKQWEAIEWAIDCGISAAKTQFSDDEETVALAPVLQSVLDEINGRA